MSSGMNPSMMKAASLLTSWLASTFPFGLNYLGQIYITCKQMNCGRQNFGPPDVTPVNVMLCYNGMMGFADVY